MTVSGICYLFSFTARSTTDSTRYHYYIFCSFLNKLPTQSSGRQTVLPFSSKHHRILFPFISSTCLITVVALNSLTPLFHPPSCICVEVLSSDLFITKKFQFLNFLSTLFSISNHFHYHRVYRPRVRAIIILVFPLRILYT